ncbi:unnamed protein product [Paramecium primaurelia]|uniref:Uncharacterized protein n=1 Tax=Paramecium primaurelia TaxID=5886 RepID=A0A8S1N1Z0_PARPR|nr:unnamed protein product [Paramecium primaurelia]
MLLMDWKILYSEIIQNKAASSDTKFLAQVAKSGFCKLMKVDVFLDLHVFFIEVKQLLKRVKLRSQVSLIQQLKQQQELNHTNLKNTQKSKHLQKTLIFLMNSILQNQVTCACYKNKLSCKSR